MPDDYAAQVAEIRRMVAEAREHLVHQPGRDADKAAAGFNAAGEAALNLLVARMESDEPPAGFSEDERVAWRLVSHSSDELSHGNQRLSLNPWMGWQFDRRVNS